MSAEPIALGFSGGGDSSALLHALRLAYPNVPLHALIVDHRLRQESRAEAELAAARAREAGATAEILTWTDPRPGQGPARLARHRLLAKAARKHGALILCLGHTHEDRIETLRMRAARTGPPDRLVGPQLIDPAPVWPEGAGLVIARPFLTCRRAALRAWLTANGQDWIDDPSNEDTRFERIVLRADPISNSAELELLAASDAAAKARAERRAAANALLETATALTEWGGAHVTQAIWSQSDPTIRLTALEALVLALGGAQDLPVPGPLAELDRALCSGQAHTLSGVMVTPSGWLGREPGAAGRRDGAGVPAPLDLNAGETGVFDNRWQVTAQRALRVSFGGPEAVGAEALAAIPAALRPAMAHVSDLETGVTLAWLGLTSCEDTVALLVKARIAARLLSSKVPSWFDVDKVSAQMRLPPGENAS